MSDRLLREYLSLVIEKIRSRKTPGGETFDLKRFKSLKNLGDLHNYAGKYLDKLGEGSSRAAYLMSGRYALKIALNNKGIGQNEAELDVYTNPATKRIIAKIYAADERDMWLVSDLVKPITSEEEFEQLAGVSWKDFSKQVYDGIKFHDVDNASDFSKAVVATAHSNHLMVGDLIDQLNSPFKSVIDHWGKTPDGRVVLLDYGFTEEVDKQHYAPERELRRAAAAGPRAIVAPKRGDSVDSFAKTKQKSAEEEPLPQRSPGTAAAVPKALAARRGAKPKSAEEEPLPQRASGSRTAVDSRPPPLSGSRTDVDRKSRKSRVPSDEELTRTRKAGG